MTERVAHILELVDRLPREEREELMDELRERDEPAQAESSWTPELERRAREALRGENLVDADVVFAELRAELSARR